MNIEIKLKSPRSKKRLTPTKKKIAKQQHTKIVRRVNALEHWLDVHECLWHDEDYEAGKTGDDYR